MTLWGRWSPFVWPHREVKGSAAVEWINLGGSAIGGAEWTNERAHVPCCDTSGPDHMLCHSYGHLRQGERDTPVKLPVQSEYHREQCTLSADLDAEF